MKYIVCTAIYKCTFIVYNQVKFLFYIAPQSLYLHNRSRYTEGG